MVISETTALGTSVVFGHKRAKLTQMRFVYTPSDVPQWVHLFNDLGNLNGYPDERDIFHPHKDLKFCIDSIVRLYESIEVLDEYKVTLKLQVKTKKTTTSQEFFDGYELKHTDFVAQYIEPLQSGFEAFDILPAEQVLALRQLVKNAMVAMMDAVPMLVEKELFITTLEDNNKKYSEHNAP